QRAGGAVVRTLGVLREHFDQGKTECGSLAGAGLGKADHVAAFEKVRDCLRLDRRRRLVTECKEGGYELLGQAKLMEIRQVEYLFGAPKKSPDTARCRPVFF